MTKYFKNTKQSTPKYSKFIPNYIQRDIQPEMAMKRAIPGMQDSAANFPLIEDDLFAKDVENKEYKYLVKDDATFVPEEYLRNSSKSSKADEYKPADLTSVILNSSMEDYVILVDGEPLASGEKFDVEKICNELIFGKSDFFENEPLDQERICIIKKVSIKVGLFIE